MCEKCATYAFKLVDPDNSEYIFDYWYVCSKECMKTLLGKFEEGITSNEVPISETAAVNDMPDLLRKVLTSQKNKQWISNYISGLPKKELFNVNFEVDHSNKYLSGAYANSFLEGLVKHIRLTVAKNLTTAGRFEDAAKLFEKLRMYEEAGRIRAKTGEIRIRKMEVSLDINSLLGQLKEGGIVVVYRCPNCGGNLKIGKDTSVESLKQCSHCGSKIETMDLADFLRTALS